MFFAELETDRLFLRNISREYREFIFRQFSSEAVNRYLFDAEPVQTMAEADELVDSYLLPEPRTHHRWILVLKDTGEAIGTCGFHCWDRGGRAVELGYDMQEEYQGHGYMTEALRAILAFAQDQMDVDAVHAHIYEENLRSVNLAERLGFRFLGETTSYSFRGREYPHRIYTLTFSRAE